MNKDNKAVTLRVMDIVDGTTVDGTGFRTSIYFAGCEHHCPHCHNQATWPMDAGEELTVSELMARIEENDLNVTFSGGDPMYQAASLLSLAKEISRLGKTIWCYTGFTYEQVKADPQMSRLLDYIDVLVDGPYINDLRDTSLLFRGSSNQRLISVKESRDGDMVLWQPEF